MKFGPIIKLTKYIDIAFPFQILATFMHYFPFHLIFIFPLIKLHFKSLVIL